MPHLAVFSSNNSGLCKWDGIGSLHREVAIYKKFAEDGWDVSFYTYDRTRNLPEVGFPAKVHPQWPWLLPKRSSGLYRSLLPYRFVRAGSKADVIITNQAHSAGAAIRAGKLWAAKVVARCGYVYGESAETLGKSGKRTGKRILQEKHTFEKADACVIPTKELGDWVSRNYNIPSEKTRVIPNYVDTEQFKPNPDAEKEFDIICVGRLVAKKRHKLLLEALAQNKLRVHFAGNGRLKDQLRDMARQRQMEIEITPRIEHSELPAHINRAKIYVNLAAWEGHPKGLIEAMACGCTCVGAKSPGIENLIIDGETGILIEPEPEKIRKVVEMLLENRAERQRLGENARKYAVEYFSIEKVFEQYRQVFTEIMAG